MSRRRIAVLVLPVLVAGGLAVSPVASTASAAATRAAVTSVSPALGETRARQLVTIHGSGFSHVRSVRFGNRKAGSVVALSSHTIVAFAPALGAGTRDVTVDTAAGTSRRVHADRYTYRRGYVPSTRLLPRAAPLPAGAGRTHAADIENLSAWSCGTATRCVAVGTYETAHGAYAAMALVRDARTTAVSKVAGAAGLIDVSCAGPRFCAATGTDAHGAPVLATLVAGRWTVRHLPRLDGSGSLSDLADLGGLSCAAAGHCVFAAQEQSGSVGDLFTLSGTTVSVQAARQPANGDSHPNVSLESVTCATTTWCVVLGNYGTASGTQDEMAIVLAKGTASVSELFGPHHSAGPDITDLECPAVSRCYGVGGYVRSASGPFHGEFAVLDASGWHAVAVPDPVDADSFGPYLTALSCPSTGSCVGVGSYYPRRHHQQGRDGLIVRLHGSTVTEQTAPAPASGPLNDEQLEGVSCRSMTSCVAVGSVDTGALSETLTRAGVWVPDALGRQSHAPAGSQADLSDVTCPAYATCLAGGYDAYDFDGGEANSARVLYAVGLPR